MLLLQGESLVGFLQVQFLVGELGPQKPHRAAKKKKIQKLKENDRPS